MNILIVDDDALVVMSLKTILEASGSIKVIATGNDGSDAISLYDTYKEEVDILLMDIRMEKVSGLVAAKSIIEQHKDAKVLLLTTFLDDEYIIEAIRIGAKGYILKQDFASIAPALTAVYNGQNVFGSDIVEKIPELMNKSTNEENVYEKCEKLGLNEKEADIISLIAEGLNNKEIAEKLYFSEGTVRNYISTVLEKLGLRDRTQIACYYYKCLK